MLSFYNIWTIARFEIKTLSRSWFLRIFSGLAFIFLFFYNVTAFTDLFNDFTPRMMYGMSSSLPYSNLLFFNIVQAVITVFLASDFLKRDKKLDTTEAIYIRSMTNSDYVLGKTLGIFTIFISLNIFILLMTAAVNAAAHSTEFNLAAYFFYPLLISVPTLIFIIGLSFLTMTLIRNQAVTFILLLGYIGVTIIYLGGNYYNIFDYTGFYVPMLYSDFIGFGNTTELILHRGMYVLIGFSCIFLTIYLFRRLPQSNSMQRLSIILAVVLFAGSIFTGFIYVNKFFEGQELRSNMIELNKKYFDKPVGSITANNINLIHHGEIIECTSEITINNNSDDNLDELIFSLNPGLKITRVTAAGSELDFQREQHIVKVKPASLVEPGENLVIKMEYSGSINDDACYLDIYENKRNTLKRIASFTSQKMYSIVSPEFVLLTSENLWYPIAGVTYNPEAQFGQRTYFSNYSIKVKTSPNLTAVSQGRLAEQEGGKFLFEPEVPLPKISLVIGPFEKRSIEVDSVNYNLYIKKNHNYFDEYFTEIGDTLSALIRDSKQDYERDVNLTYSYPRFSMVETPIQFTYYDRIWTSSFETNQPEMIFLPENGINLNGADFKQRSRMQERWGNRGNQVILPREKQSNEFNSFVKSTFFDGPASFRFRMGGSSPEYSGNPYSAFPNYYSFVNNLSSSELPLLNIILEMYLKVEDDNSSAFNRFDNGLTNYETAILKFSGQNLKEIIADTTNSLYMKDLLKIKGKYFFTGIEKDVGKTEWRNLLQKVLDENRFKTISFNLLNESMMRNYSVDMLPVINRWYNSSELPGYYIAKVETGKIIDNQRERYQIQFNVTNPEMVDGFLHLSFSPRRGQQGGRGRRFNRPGAEEELIDERIIFVGGNTTKKIGVVLDEAPGNLKVNTLLSQNLPLQQDIIFEEFEENKKAVPFDGEEILGEIEPFTNRTDIIIDNEGEGFEVINPEQKSWLKKVLNFSEDDEEKYIGLRYWWSPENWRAAIHPEAYGKFIHSVHYTKAGDGNIKVVWSAEIKQSGYYDVYCHAVKPQGGRRRGGNEEKYQYSIHHDDGSEEVTLEINNAEKGWNMLGSFYFSEGTAKVELTNDSPDGLIIADAVKWILRK